MAMVCDQVTKRLQGDIAMIMINARQNQHIGRNMCDKLRLGNRGGITAQNVTQGKSGATATQINSPEGQPQICGQAWRLRGDSTGQKYQE